MRFTADEAFDAAEVGEPIVLTSDAIDAILAKHDIDETRADYEAFCREHMKNPYDAAELLGWLGYYASGSDHPRAPRGALPSRSLASWHWVRTIKGKTLMLTLDREFYIPKGAVKVADKRSDAVAYLYSNNSGVLCAVGFHGKAQKPDWRYAFRSPTEREATVRRHFEHWQAIAARRAAQRATKARPSKLQVGHMLVSVWGYEQTNVNFYQVTREISATMVEVRPIASTTVKEDGWASGKCVPSPDSFTGEPMRRRVSNGDRVKVSDSQSASLWDGRPMSWTAWH